MEINKETKEVEVSLAEFDFMNDICDTEKLNGWTVVIKPKDETERRRCDLIRLYLGEF